MPVVLQKYDNVPCRRRLRAMVWYNDSESAGSSFGIPCNAYPTSVLKQFKTDFMVPVQHSMKCLEFSGMRCNAAIFTNISVFADIPRNA